MGSIAHRLVDLKLEDATASSTNDKVMIDRLIVDQLGGFEKMNGFLREKMFKALKSCGDHFQEDFNELLRALAVHSPSGCLSSPGFARIALKNHEDSLRHRRATVHLTKDISVFLLGKN